MVIPNECFEKQYKRWRNLARPFNRESLQSLEVKLTDNVSALRARPWLTCLLVKWICQDRMVSNRTKQTISKSAYNKLIRELGEIDESATNFFPEDGLRLAMRRMMRPQISFQRTLTKGYVREAMLVAQADSPWLRDNFERDTGFSLEAFTCLSFFLIVKVTVEPHHFLEESDFQPFFVQFGKTQVQSFLNSISKSPDQLCNHFRSFEDATKKRGPNASKSRLS